jgi:hypothetical protein
MIIFHHISIKSDDLLDAKNNFFWLRFIKGLQNTQSLDVKHRYLLCANIQMIKKIHSVAGKIHLYPIKPY